MPEYHLEELSPEDADALTKEMQAVLEKYDAELGIKSMIEIMKRVPVGIPSPLTHEDLEENESNESETTEAD